MKIGKFNGKITTESVFFLAYGMFLLATLLTTTFYFQYIKGVIYNSVLTISLLLLLIRELFEKRISRKCFEGLLVCLLISGLFIIANVSNRNVLVMTVFFVCFARNISFDKIAGFSAILSFIFIVFIVCSSLTGVIPNYSTFSGGRTRYFIGFLYALFPSTIMFNVTMLRIYGKKSKILWKELGILFLLNGWIYLQTKSRLTFTLASLLILFSVFMKRVPHFFDKKILLRKFLSWGFVICALLSLVIMCLYGTGSTEITAIDFALDHRIYLAKEAFNKHGVSLFGRQFAMIGNGLDIYGNSASYSLYTYIDNWYMQILLRNGIIFFLIFIALLTSVARRSARIDKDGYLPIILFELAVMCVIQDSILCVYYNTFIFLIGFYLLNSIHDILNMKKKDIVRATCEY